MEIVGLACMFYASFSSKHMYLSSWVGGKFKLTNQNPCDGIWLHTWPTQFSWSRWWFPRHYCPHQRRNYRICRRHNWIHGICQSSKKNCQIWLIFEEILRSNQAIKSLTLMIKKFLNLVLHQYLTAAGKSYFHEKIPWIPTALHIIFWTLTSQYTITLYTIIGLFSTKYPTPYPIPMMELEKLPQHLP